MKQKPYCNKLNKDFKNGPHQKKKKTLKANTDVANNYHAFDKELSGTRHSQTSSLLYLTELSPKLCKW